MATPNLDLNDVINTILEDYFSVIAFLETHAGTINNST